MKKFILIFFLIMSQNLLAYKMHSQISFSAETGLSKNLIIDCTEGELLCKKTCDNVVNCIVPEVLCTDCASEKSHEMNTIYSSKADEYFQSGRVITSDDAISYFLKNKKIMTISYDLFLNFFTPELSSEISVVFNNICGNSSNKNMMLAEINSETNSIEAIPGIICANSEDNAELHELVFNPKYSVQKNEFWKALQNESEKAFRRMGLKLELSKELRLP